MIFILLFVTAFLHSAPWTPPVVITEDHPRILFTAEDSASVHDRLFVSPWSSYYSTIWSRANTTSGNASEVEDMNRARIALSAAFVLYFNVKPGGDTLTTIERNALSDKAIDYNNNLLGFTGSRVMNSDYHYPSQRLIMYAVAYDLLQGAGISVSQSSIADLANEIYDNATYSFLGVSVDDLVLIYNHKLIVAGALGTAAVAMPENTNAKNWIDYAMVKMNQVTFSVENDPATLSGFAEGPHYLKYSIEHLAMWFLGMKHFIGDATYEYIDPCGGDDTDYVPSPWFDSRWDNIHLWISLIRMPNGNIPAIGDAFRNNGYCFGAPFAERNPAFYWNTSIGGSRILVHPMMVAVGADTTGPMPPGLTALPYAGNLIFRSSQDNGSIYFHYYGAHGIANTLIHNQSDAASFMLYAYGDELAIDPGYIQYSERGRVNQIQHHNTILVNGGGPGTTASVDAFIDKFFEIEGLYYGEVSTSYSSSDINRRAGLLGERFIVLIEDLRRPTSAEFTFQCHGWGLESEGNFSASPNGGLWTQGNHLRAVVDAPNGLDGIRYETSTHETGYLAWADHTVLRADKSGTNTRIISVLYPFCGATGSDLRYDVPSMPGHASIRFGAMGLEGVLMAASNNEHLFIPDDSELPLCEAFAESAVFLADSASKRLMNIYVSLADSARFDDDFLFKITPRRDLALSYQEDGIIHGYLNDEAATVSFPSEHEPSLLEGAVSHSWDGSFVHIELAEFSHFSLDTSPLSYHEEVSRDKMLLVYPNPSCGMVNIKMENLVSVEVYDIMGRVIISKNYTQPSSSANLHIEGKPGIYIIKLTDNQHNQHIVRTFISR